MGAPYQHYSCPNCGEKMERRGEHEIEIKEDLYRVDKPKIKKTSTGHIIPKTPPQFGTTVPSPMAAFGEDMSFDEVGDKVTKGDEPSRLYWTALGRLSSTKDNTSKTPEEIHDDIVKTYKKIYKEGELVEKYLDFLQTEDFLGSIKKVSKKAAAKLSGPPGPSGMIHRAYWATKPGGKIPWPSQTSQQVASIVK
jgi:hypothetical protein